MRTRIAKSMLFVAISLGMLACGASTLFGPTPTSTLPHPTPTSTLHPPTPTPACALKCSIDTKGYSFDITCESGTVSTEYLGQKTEYLYDSSGNQTGLKLSVNQKKTYENTKNTYTIKGTIELNQVLNTFSYDITGTGGVFGNTPQNCKSGAAEQSQPLDNLPTPAFTTTETTETLVPNSLLGVWKADDMRAPDNSWNISYSVYFQFINTKQYVYHGVDTFNSNRPTDVSDIVYLNDSTFIKKIINIPDHPEYLGKFQKWTWRFDNGNVLFTVYGMMDSQDLALNDGTITALATGVKVH
jgi:hypothetical protein